MINAYCSKCKVTCAHSYETIVLGVMRFRHRKPNSRHYCDRFYVENQKFATLRRAWLAARELHDDDLWRRMIDAMVLERNQRKANRLRKRLEAQGGTERGIFYRDAMEDALPDWDGWPVTR